MSNWQNIAGSQAITGLVAIGLVAPLATGAFDLSVGYTLGTTAALAAWLSSHGVATVPTVVLCVGSSLLIGCMNGLVVVGIGVDSFIATLGTGAVLGAITYLITGNQQIVGVSESLQSLGTSQPAGIPITVIYLAVLAVIAWWLLEHTPFGRQLHAIGGGTEAARLAGVPTRRYTFLALLISASAAGTAGIVATASLGAASPDTGSSYLLPSFAAAILGATQVKPGRYNVLGTIIAIYLLATGVTGLTLYGANLWATSLFNGLALIVAVSLALHQHRLRFWRRFRNAVGSTDGVESP
jgi:ribose transport system permease protein